MPPPGFTPALRPPLPRITARVLRVWVRFPMTPASRDLSGAGGGRDQPDGAYVYFTGVSVIATVTNTVVSVTPADNESTPRAQYPSHCRGSRVNPRLHIATPSEATTTDVAEVHAPTQYSSGCKKPDRGRAEVGPPTCPRGGVRTQGPKSGRAREVA